MNQNDNAFLENLDKNGLLKNNFFQSNNFNTASESTDLQLTAPAITQPAVQNTPSANNSRIVFGNLTLAPREPVIPNKINNDSTKINGLDTEILSSTKFDKMDDGLLKQQVRIAQLKEQLEAHKDLVEAAFLKSDRNHYKKLQEIQERMEAELQRLVVDYQNRQLKSIIFSPFTKLFNLIKSYVALK